MLQARRNLRRAGGSEQSSTGPGERKPGWFGKPHQVSGENQETLRYAANWMASVAPCLVFQQAAVSALVLHMDVQGAFYLPNGASEGAQPFEV